MLISPLCPRGPSQWLAYAVVGLEGGDGYGEVTLLEVRSSGHVLSERLEVVCEAEALVLFDGVSYDPVDAVVRTPLGARSRGLGHDNARHPEQRVLDPPQSVYQVPLVVERGLSLRWLD